MPVDPGPSVWAFPPPGQADESGIVCVGGDLAPATVIEAYRHGLFPMHVDRGRTLAWWSPDPRGVIPLDGLRITRSLRRSVRRYEIRVDTAFAAVVEGCADRRRPHGWITDDIRDAYVTLHELGWAHSVEAWDPDDGELAGGLYGVAVDGLFAGESMFHRRPDASKVALVALVELLDDGRPERLLDVQWATEHLRTLGAVEIPRPTYLRRLARAREVPLPERWR